MFFNLVAFDGEEEQGVDARELHEQLEVVSRFNDWVANRIKNAQLTEGQDFITLTKNLVNGGQKKEYVLTIDSAKHISMLERTEKGKQVRQYFIEIEKRAREVHTQQPADPVLALLQSSTIVRERQLALEAKSTEHDERLEHLENVIDREEKDISVIGWANIKGYKRLIKGEPSRIGKILTKIAKANGLTPYRINDIRFGAVNAYPRTFMEQHFDSAYLQVIGSRKAC